MLAPGAACEALAALGQRDFHVRAMDGTTRSTSLAFLDDVSLDVAASSGLFDADKTLVLRRTAHAFRAYNTRRDLFLTMSISMPPGERLDVNLLCATDQVDAGIRGAVLYDKQVRTTFGSCKPWEGHRGALRAPRPVDGAGAASGTLCWPRALELWLDQTEGTIVTFINDVYM